MGLQGTYTEVHSLWQYTNSGTVSDISGYVDMDYIYKDFPSVINPKTTPKPAAEEVIQVANGPFKDVPADLWSAPAIQRLKDKGIFHGCSDGTFGPTDNMTREEAAADIDNGLKYLGKLSK